jgi:phosphohistidine phosphatase
MMLYFVRHGKALDASLMDDDASRPLTEKGIKRIQRMGRVLARMDIHPHALFASPRVRAQQTAQYLAEALGVSVTTREEVNFGFSVAHVRALTAPYPYDAELMFVGHNDSISHVVTELTGANVSLEVGMIAAVATLAPTLQHSRLVWMFGNDVAKALD